MKKIILVFLLCLAMGTIADAQTISEKVFSTKGSYGQKKFKKAPRKVYISRFQVYFHVIASASAHSTGGTTIGGGSVKGNTTTTMTVAVGGVDTEDFQKITDDTYNKFVADLKSKGFEIVGAEDVTSIPFYEDWILKDGGEVNYANVPGYVSVTPSGTKYLVKNETRKGREKQTFLDRTPRISKELDDVIVVEATFAFPFIEMTTKSSNMVGFSAVKAKTNFEMWTATGSDGLANLVEMNQLKFTSGSGPGASANAYFTGGLKKPVELPGVFKDEKFKEFTTAETKSLGSTAVPNYFGVVFAENRKDNVTNMADCDHDKYVKTTTSAINEFIEMTLEEFYANALD